MLTYDQIESKLQDLHMQRGHAARHGKDVSKITAEIMLLHEAQATLQDVESAKVAEARDDAAKEHDSQVQALRQEIADLGAASLKATAEAESALRKAVKAQVLVHTHEAAKRKAQAKLNQLTGVKDTIDSEHELYRRGSRLWLVQLNLLTSSPGQFGDLKFPSLHLPPATKAWT